VIKPLFSILAACLMAAACTAGAQDDPINPRNAALAPIVPDFKDINHWINSEPLTMEQLRGKIILVEFWTYDCINCLRALPYVKQWHERYQDQGLVVVGVHTPEYPHEKLLGNVEEAVKQLGIVYPVAQDNDYRTWNAFGNRYWPAVYLIDQGGRIVYRHFGEGAYAETEARIQQLLSSR
jgi:thiol-disulfide isomerase/thioredoxin